MKKVKADAYLELMELILPDLCEACREKVNAYYESLKSHRREQLKSQLLIPELLG